MTKQLNPKQKKPLDPLVPQNPEKNDRREKLRMRLKQQMIKCNTGGTNIHLMKTSGPLKTKIMRATSRTALHKRSITEAARSVTVIHYNTLNQ